MPFRFLAVALLAFTQLAAPAPMSDPEAYAVYKAYLAAARPASLIPPAPLLIQATTETWDPGPHCGEGGFYSSRKKNECGAE